MILYHGSNISVSSPIIFDSNRALDFGKGFYVTTDLDQAIKWSKITTVRRNEGKPTVSVYKLIENKNLKILEFDKPDINWLKFVATNRKDKLYESDYDIIIGPVANDNTMPVINGYLDNFYDENETIKRLLTQNLKDQIVFKTDESLKYLQFLEAKSYE